MFIKSSWGGRQLDMGSVKFLTGGHISELVLDDSEHLTDGVENTARELVLVIDGQPAAQHLADSGL